jgi:histone H3/H4
LYLQTLLLPSRSILKQKLMAESNVHVTKEVEDEEEFKTILVKEKSHDMDDEEDRAIDSRLKHDVFFVGDKNVVNVDEEYHDTEGERDDCYEDEHDNPSHSPSYTEEEAVVITGSSNESLNVDSLVLSAARISKKRKGFPTKESQEIQIVDKGLIGLGNRKHGSSGTTICRTPSVHGLTIPFRTIKKAMKLDPDIPIVQNEAAIMTTVAVELFLKRLVVKSNLNAKTRGRNTVRYEDVAEARTADKSLSFLEPLLP